MKKQTPKEDMEQFPGYPYYPAGEDITNLHNGTHKTNIDPDEGAPKQKSDSPKPRTEARNGTDVSPEDRDMLSAAYQNRDLEDADAEESELDTTDEDGDPLNESGDHYGNIGNDLDVPGSEADDADERNGEEDEENNYYSLGGDNHENLEEDNAV